MPQLFRISLIVVISTLLSAAHPTPPVANKTPAVVAKCKNDPRGPRRKYRCNVYMTKAGKAWAADSIRARKLYIHKAAGDTGLEELRWRIGQSHWRVVAIRPGFQRTIFVKAGRDSKINVEAVIRTVRLNRRGRSAFYVHFETLDPPESMSIPGCENDMTEGGAQVCYRREI